MDIQIGKRKCYCRYVDCEITNGVIYSKEKRVSLNEFHYGYAHPVCALKILKDKIDNYIEIRNQFLEEYKDQVSEMVAYEL